MRIMCVLIMLFCSGSAAYATDFTEILMDDDGCPVRNDFTTARTSQTVAKPGCYQDAKLDTPLWRPDLTLGDLIFYSLSVTISTESPQPSGEEKFKRRELAVRLRSAKDLTLSPEEIILVKKVTGILWPPSIIGAVYTRIDPSVRK